MVRQTPGRPQEGVCRRAEGSRSPATQHLPLSGSPVAASLDTWMVPRGNAWPMAWVPRARRAGRWTVGTEHRVAWCSLHSSGLNACGVLGTQPGARDTESRPGRGGGWELL